LKSPSRRPELAQDGELIGAIDYLGGAGAEDEMIRLAGAGTINGTGNKRSRSDGRRPRWGSARFERAA
jgi:hypothetical protein